MIGLGPDLGLLAIDLQADAFLHHLGLALEHVFGRSEPRRSLIERRADSISDALREFTAAAVPAGRDASAHADRILSNAISDTGDGACLVAVRIL